MRGVVVDNVDPMNVGRCKVRFFRVFADLSDDLLPWAEYADPFMGGGVDVGGFFVPDIGTVVWGFFEEDNPHKPVYFAGSSAKPFHPAEKNNGYPSNRVFKTKKGNMIEINDKEGDSYIKITHHSGTSTTMKDNGDVEDIITGNYFRTIAGDMTETVDGNVQVEVGGNFSHTVAGSAVLSASSSYRVKTDAGYVMLQSTFDINGIIFDSHGHNQAPDSGGDSQQKTQAPVN